MFDLEILDNYYRKNRQVGHTLALVNGAKSDKNVLVVVANKVEKTHIELPEEQMITMDNLREKLLGRKNPVLVDHFTLQVMYWDMRKELDRKDEEITKLENKLIKSQKRILNMGGVIR